MAVPFWIFAASNVVIVAALIWWRKPRNAAESLPAERLVSAVRAGVRHAVNNPYLRATLMRVLAFLSFRQRLFGAAARSWPGIRYRGGRKSTAFFSVRSGSAPSGGRSR